MFNNERLDVSRFYFLYFFVFDTGDSSCCSCDLVLSPSFVISYISRDCVRCNRFITTTSFRGSPLASSTLLALPALEPLALSLSFVVSSISPACGRCYRSISTTSLRRSPSPPSTRLPCPLRYPLSQSQWDTTLYSSISSLEKYLGILVFSPGLIEPLLYFVSTIYSEYEIYRDDHLKGLGN